jgi:hypothetical protein
VELKTKTERATNLVNSYKERGVIKSEFSETWVKQAIENYDAVEAQLDSLNTTIKLPIAGAKREVSPTDLKNYEGFETFEASREKIRLANQNKTK